MKTTVEISDVILDEVRKVAVRDGRTLRDLVEEGLRNVLSQNKSKGRFRLRKASYKGKGMKEGVREGSWETVRDVIYEGRGA